MKKIMGSSKHAAMSLPAATSRQAGPPSVVDITDSGNTIESKNGIIACETSVPRVLDYDGDETNNKNEGVASKDTVGL